MMEQIKKDLEIIKIELRQFALAMYDHWDSEDYKLDDELKDKRKKLTEEYVATYGVNPKIDECKCYEDVIKLKNRLADEIGA